RDVRAIDDRRAVRPDHHRAVARAGLCVVPARVGVGKAHAAAVGHPAAADPRRLRARHVRHEAHLHLPGISPDRLVHAGFRSAARRGRPRRSAGQPHARKVSGDARPLARARLYRGMPGRRRAAAPQSGADLMTRPANARLAGVLFLLYIATAATAMTGEILGPLLFKAMEWSAIVSAMAFAAGSAVYVYLLLRGRTIPAPLERQEPAHV